MNHFDDFLNETSGPMNREKLKGELKKKFPKIWVKNTEEFDNGNTKNGIWTREGSYDKSGNDLFNHYDTTSKYTQGVRKELYDFLEKSGWYPEWHDSGTVFIFPESDVNESEESELESDIRDFLEKELQYNEDSHVDDDDVDQIYHAFISKYKKYKHKKSLHIYDKIHDYFAVLESFSKKWDDLSKEDKLSLLHKGQKVNILRGRHKGKSGIISRVEFEKNGDLVGDQIDVKVDGSMSYLGLDDIRIDEAKVTLKRKYAHHPPHVVGSHAPIRERVLSFVKEKGEVSEEEITQYVTGLREESGKEGGSGWLKRNPEYFEKKGYKLILSKKGERYLNSKKVNESRVKRFEDFLNEGKTLKSKGLMPLSDALSIFVSDSRILTGMTFEEFTEDLYHTNDSHGGKDLSGILKWVEKNWDAIKKNWNSPCDYVITKDEVSLETQGGLKFRTDIKDTSIKNDAIPVIDYKKWIDEMF